VKTSHKKGKFGTTDKKIKRPDYKSLIHTKLEEKLKPQNSSEIIEESSPKE